MKHFPELRWFFFALGLVVGSWLLTLTAPAPAAEPVRFTIHHSPFTPLCPSSVIP